MRRMNFRFLLAWILALMPMLDVYTTPIPGIDCGELVLLLFGSLALITKSTFQKMEKPLLLLYVYALLTTLVNSLFIEVMDIGIVLNNLLSYFLYFILFIIAINIGIKDVLCEVVVKVGRIVASISLFQWFLLIFGIKVILLVPFVPLSYGIPYNVLQSGLNTITGPFTEPAHLAEYLAVPLLLTVIRNKNDWKTIALLAFPMLLTMKGTAVVMLGAIFLCRLLLDFKKENIGHWLKFGVILCISVGTLMMLIPFVPSLQKIFDRVYEIFGNSKVETLGYFSGSGYFRVKYGFDFFGTLPAIKKISGIGIGHFFGGYDKLSALPPNIFFYYQDSELLGFRSGFTTYLIDLGLIGVFILLSALFRKKNKYQKLLSFAFCCQMLISGDINNSRWLLYMVLIFSAFSDKTNPKLDILPRKN